jgi:hypothetical protein
MAASAAEDQDINEPLAKRSLKLRDLVHSAVIQKRMRHHAVPALVANEHVCLFFLYKLFRKIDVFFFVGTGRTTTSTTIRSHRRIFSFIKDIYFQLY